MTHRTIQTLASGLAACLAADTHAQSTGFWLVGTQPGGTTNAVSALSRDGSIAVGGGYGMPVYTNVAFHWTQSGGRVDWGLGPGMPLSTYTTCIDDSGQIIAGVMSWGPFRRVGEGPLENLGVLPGYQWSNVTGMSGDGSVIVGTSTEQYHPQWATYEAFRWTPAGGLEGLGNLVPNKYLREATGVSRDGSTIVGSEGLGIPFALTEDAGLTLLLGGSSARAVNADGSVIVGSLSTPNWSHAARWENGQWKDIASFLYTFKHSTAFAVSDDGSVVGGDIQTSPLTVAFIWTQDTGMVKLDEYLALFGIAVPAGFVPRYVYAFSGNGRTMGGYGYHPSTKKYEGWVAAVPAEPLCVADCDQSGTPDIDDFLCFQTLFALGDLKADCDKNLVLEIDDFLCFQTAFSLGC